MAGCNFRCRGCFSSEKYTGSVEVTGARIGQYIPADKEVMLAGSEPTIDNHGLLELINE